MQKNEVGISGNGLWTVVDRNEYRGLGISDVTDRAGDAEKKHDHFFCDSVRNFIED